MISRFATKMPTTTERQHGNINVAQVIGNQEKRRVRRLADDLDLHPGQNGETPRPCSENDLPPVGPVGDSEPEDEPRRIKPACCQKEKRKFDRSEEILHSRAKFNISQPRIRGNTNAFFVTTEKVFAFSLSLNDAAYHRFEGAQ